MACGCGKRRTAAAATAPAPTMILEVYVNGEPTGRRFTSAIAAQSYASRVGGEVRPG